MLSAVNQTQQDTSFIERTPWLSVVIHPHVSALVCLFQGASSGLHREANEDSTYHMSAGISVIGVGAGRSGIESRAGRQLSVVIHPHVSALVCHFQGASSELHGEAYEDSTYHMSAGISVIGVGAGCRLDGPESNPVQAGSGAHPAFYTMGTGLISRVVALTTHSHRKPRLRKE
jgi:hypothetical protein